MSALTRFLSGLRIQNSMGWMLHRDDDHLLHDIGLSRDDLLTMIELGCDDLDHLRQPAFSHPRARKDC